MTSTSKMVLFFLAATVFNILLMSILVILFWVVAAIVPAPNIRLVILFVGFIASIVLTFLAYGRVMKWVTVRFELEKHIPQLFKGRKKIARQDGRMDFTRVISGEKASGATIPRNRWTRRYWRGSWTRGASPRRRPTGSRGGSSWFPRARCSTQVRRCYQKPWFQDAPHVLIVAGRTSDAWARQDAWNSIETDLTIAMDHMILAAENEGVAPAGWRPTSPVVLRTRPQPVLGRQGLRHHAAGLPAAGLRQEGTAAAEGAVGSGEVFVGEFPPGRTGVPVRRVRRHGGSERVRSTRSVPV